jgi:5'(3')-deoxyribonucleotidase
MDGVLADMFGEAARREGTTHWRKARKEKDRIDQVAQEPGFFAELPALPQAGKLLHGVLKLAGQYSILSSPLMSDVEQSSREKADWINRKLSKIPPQSIIFDHQKEKFARQANGTPNILIDDWDVNIHLWESLGGIGILYKDGECDKALKRLHYALEGLIPANEVDDEQVDLSVDNKLYTNQQVLKYVKGIHNEYHLDKPILKHKTWILREVPVGELQTSEFYDQDDPYRRVIDLDWDHIDNVTIQDILKKPVVADSHGWLLDGNHRVIAARAKGLSSIRALVPYQD